MIEDGIGEAFVIDYGIARTGARQRIEEVKVKKDDMISGTPMYMSPEHLEPEKLSGKSDVFILGIDLYEALTGVNPFQGKTLKEIIYNVCNLDPTPSREINPNIRKSTEAAVI